jgi:hypothetical protein
MTQDTPTPDPSGDDARTRWEERYARSRVREADFTTLSGM